MHCNIERTICVIIIINSNNFIYFWIKNNNKKYSSYELGLHVWQMD